MSHEDLDKAAIERFGENEESIGKVVKELKDWLNSQPHLTSTRRDEPFLRMFHRGCGGGNGKSDLDRTKQKYDLFFSARSHLPAWFSEWDASSQSIQHILKAGVYLPLQGYDKKGRYAILVRHNKIDPSTMSTEDCYRTLLMVSAIAIEGNRQAYTNGYVLLAEHEGVTASHVLMMTPSIMKRHTVIFQDSYPMENQQLIDSSTLYLLNIPSLMEKIFNIFLGYLDEKFKSMIKLVKINEDNPEPFNKLQEEIGTEILPAEYGGTNGSVEDLIQYWLMTTNTHKEWLKKESETFKVDEELRPGKSRTTADIYGSSCAIM